MAELILSTAGAAAGAVVGGPIGAVIGAGLGAAGGRELDRRLFTPSRRIEGPRIDALRLSGASEGDGVALVFGRIRISGTVIWAARPKERIVSSEAGKGGGTTTAREARYSLSLAVALGEGVVRRIERCWANGAPFDLSAVAWRLHPGTEDQEPDPLIEAIEGAAAAPAYRGVAYVVFEDLPLGPFGDAMPQFAFEVVTAAPRAAPDDRLEDLAQGVCLIPGAGEFALATTPIIRRLGPGEEVAENRSLDPARADLLVSLDRLGEELPNVRSVMLVVGWFGTDLRAGACDVRPGVDAGVKDTRPRAWRVAGLERAEARLVSQIGGTAAFGGTPDDESVREAIVELKRRGYAVSLYPFLFMDIPPDSGLPNPTGGGFQPAFPWRGRITGTDGAAQARDEVARFFDDGPWSYRRFVLHYAELAAAAGGVDGFVIGSELRGLTTLRDDGGDYPAVDRLRGLAAAARAVLGPATRLTYAADWSEYYGHQPADGSGDVTFHLDPLWADPNIDAVGIDWYAPLSDWREGQDHLDAAAAASPYAPGYLDARVAGGEGFDWFYRDDNDRAGQIRTPIADGAYGKPWVFRPKDLVSWWREPHVNRRSGVEAAQPTAWVPCGKPIWLVEVGCPAIDKGANAPNRFVDPKSAESAWPPFSTGARDDAIQRAALEALLRRLAPGGPLNPISPVYGGAMLTPERAHLWAWDARPYPAFPARADLWGDAANHGVGHWLNGRAGACLVADLIADLCRRAGLAAPDVSGVFGTLPGFALDAPTTPRAALSALVEALDLVCVERAGTLVFAPRAAGPGLRLAQDDLVRLREGVIELAREDIETAPAALSLAFLDPNRGYAPAVARVGEARSAAAPGALELALPIPLDEGVARALAQRLLAQARAARSVVSVALPPAFLGLEPGDPARVDAPGLDGARHVARIVDGRSRKVSLRRAAEVGPAPLLFAPAAGSVSPAEAAVDLAILDLPPLPGREDDHRPLAAAFAKPWPGGLELWAGADAGAATPRARLTQPACVGRLVDPLWPGPTGRFDEGNFVRVRFSSPPPASVARGALLDGANLFAVENGRGGWELVQAGDLTLQPDGTYRVAMLLRGQQGGEADQGAPAPAGARIVAIDARLARAEMAAEERGVALAWFVTRVGARPSAEAAGVTATWDRRAALPFSPTRLSAWRTAEGGVEARWVRRARVGGDAWAIGEVPLGESEERYEARLLRAGVVVAAKEAAAPAVSFAPAEAAAAFAAPAAEVRLEVRQWSAIAGYGARAESILGV